MKVVEVQCVTVIEAIKFGAKRKHDDVDGNENQEGINIKKLKSSSKAKGSGRPNQGREEDNKNLWEALKAGIQFERSAHQSKKLEKFKAGTIVSWEYVYIFLKSLQAVRTVIT